MCPKADVLHPCSMTGVGGRPELIIEGSYSIEGGWQEYNFVYKPGNISETPPIVGQLSVQYREYISTDYISI